MAKKNWIKKAINPGQKGSLRRALNVPDGKNIPVKKLNAAAKRKGKIGQKARLAKTLRKFS